MTVSAPLQGVLLLITGLVIMAALTYYVSKRSTTHYVPLNWEIVTFPAMNGGRVVYSTWERLFYPVFSRVDTVLSAFLGRPLGTWEFNELQWETALTARELALTLQILEGLGWLTRERMGAGFGRPPGEYLSLTAQGEVQGTAARRGSGGALWGPVHEQFMAVVSGLSLGSPLAARALPGPGPTRLLLNKLWLQLLRAAGIMRRRA
jgi:hypothetical protein